MELQQLEYFRVVARTEHVTQAAEELAITQPALSRAMSRLERDLGVALFDHRGRSVKLNRYGQAFLKHVERALGALYEGRRELIDLADRDAGVIAFGFAHALGTSVVPDLIASFREQHPRARFQLLQNASHIILDELEAGEVDLALVSPVPATGERIESIELSSEELFLVVPHDHRFAKRASVRLSELRDDTFVCLREGYGLRTLTDHFCEQAGFAPKISFEGEEIATLRSLVAVGLGVAIIPAASSPVESTPPQLRISQPLCRRSIGLLWEPARYQPELAQGFRHHIISAFPALSTLRA
ncbi:MAG TPA: LysR family transcriptional regulator [Candidatus Baltobacteraceae bacterium]|nr:LysR family transcriptional regulator [Candidatus Baltobacteraceae bacterium]